MNAQKLASGRPSSDTLEAILDLRPYCQFHNAGIDMDPIGSRTDHILTLREINEIVEEQRSWLVNKLITGTLTASEWGEEVKKLDGWKDLLQP